MAAGRTRGLGFAVAAAFLWGTIPLAAKASVAAASPTLVVTLRFVGAGVLLLVLLAARGLARGRTASMFGRPTVAELGVVAFAATVLVLEYLFYLEGLARTSAVVGQVVFQLNVLLTLALGALFFGERLTRAKVTGAGIALGGVALVSWNGRPLADLAADGTLLGNGLVLVGAIFWSVYLLLQKRVSVGATEPLRPLVLVFAAAALVTAPASPWGSLGGLPAAAVIAIAWMAIATAGAYACFVRAVETLEVGRAAVVNTFGPVATLALVSLFHVLDPASPLWEAPTVAAMAGTALVVAGIAFVARG